LTFVSIVIPTRNRPHMLLRALYSVLSQGIRNIEIIIVDSSNDKYRLLNSKIIEKVSGTIEIKYI
jgi:glycosyltransferase involved in cell wall biosynthesis